MTTKNGFTLFEVLVALTMIGLVLGAVLSLQYSLSRTTAKASALFERFWQMSLFLEQTSLKPPPLGHRRTKMVGDPSVHLTYEQFKPPASSAFAKIPNLIIERVEGRAQDSARTYADTMVALTYHKEEDDEKTERD